ncbi:MAG: hypothetical protein WCK76_10085 [Elusimicrobiota bacterium]
MPGKDYKIRAMTRREVDLAVDWAAALPANRLFGVTAFELA